MAALPSPSPAPAEGQAIGHAPGPARPRGGADRGLRPRRGSPAPLPRTALRRARAPAGGHRGREAGAARGGACAAGRWAEAAGERRLRVFPSGSRSAGGGDGGGRGGVRVGALREARGQRLPHPAAGLQPRLPVGGRALRRLVPRRLPAGPLGGEGEAEGGPRGRPKLSGAAAPSRGRESPPAAPAPLPLWLCQAPPGEGRRGWSRGLAGSGRARPAEAFPAARTGSPRLTAAI